MKILAFTSLFPNPAAPLQGLFVRARLAALGEIAHVRVIAPVRKLDPRKLSKRSIPIPQETRDGELSVTHPRFFNVPRFFKSLDARLMANGARRSFQGELRQFQPDIIDAHWGYPDGVAAAILAREAKLPYFITIRGDDISVFLNTPQRRDQMIEAMNDANGVIGVCKALVDAAIQAGVNPQRCAVVPNGVDPVMFHPEDKVHARNRLGLGPDDTIVLSVGFMTERKGFHLLVESLARLHSAPGRRAKLVIIGGTGGEDDYSERLSQVIQYHGMADRVVLVGAIHPQQLRFWYSAADLFCLASEREGWPNVLLESLACGCPVLATRVWGTPEVIPNAQIGLLVERTVPDIAQGLDTALQGPWDRPALARYAAARDWSGTARECLTVYHRFMR